MNTLRLSDNITRLRKEKKITQDALADFLGVTKASVSKWETGQCLPDILLLPKLATYFDVSIDELIGYESQMTPEQIQKTYSDLSAAFASEPFENVMQKVRDTIKRYYSCYPLLLQICILYLNHVPLAKEPKKMTAVINEARDLCTHIITDCGIVSICSDAITLKAMFDLQSGNTADVIDAIEPTTDPVRFSHQNDEILIEAYRSAGMKDKALTFTQIAMYIKVLYLLGNSVQYLSINSENTESCLSTIHRIDALADAYEIDRLHPNAMAQYNYQAALNYLQYGDEENVINRLERYADNVITLIHTDECKLHGDVYFDRLDDFIESLTLGASPPRDLSLVKQSVSESLENPVLQVLKDNIQFQNIKKRIEGI